MWGSIFLAFIALVVALFFGSDADLPLVYLPYKLEQSFSGKVVWITGASSGIGASLAEDMVKAGARVVISARRVEKLQEVAERCAQFGEPPMILPLDVTNEEDQRAAYEAVIAKYGHIDSLVLNAGRAQRSLTWETDISVTKQIMDLNFNSVVALSNLALQAMIDRKQGQIVVMSSVVGIFSSPLRSSYSASKHALHGYFDALRSEVAPHNIGVTIVCPGPVESEIVQHMFADSSVPRSPDGSKMPTARCTYLVAKAMYYRMKEVWISSQPGLLLTYIGEYLPFMNRFLWDNLIGHAVLQAEATGENAMNIIIKKLYCSCREHS